MSFICIYSTIVSSRSSIYSIHTIRIFSGFYVYDCTIFINRFWSFSSDKHTKTFVSVHIYSPSICQYSSSCCWHTGWFIWRDSYDCAAFINCRSALTGNTKTSCSLNIYIGFVCRFSCSFCHHTTRITAFNVNCILIKNTVTILLTITVHTGSFVWNVNCSGIFSNSFSSKIE